MAVKTKGMRDPGKAGIGQGERGDGRSFPTGWLIASYLALPVLFFLPALMPGVTIFGTDYLASSYIFEEFVSQRFAAGELPKWIPHVYGGVPYFANPMDIYHPITLLLRLLGVETHRHLVLIFIAQYFLAGTGTYLLVRELGARRMAAYLAGLAYLFSGYLISFVYAGHEGRAIVATLAPLFLFALHRGVRTGGIRWFALGSAVLGSALLSNQIQSAYYLLLAGGFWGVFALWHHGLFRRPRALVGRVAAAALMLTIGFSMAAINFLPFLSYIDASPRGGEGRGYEYATSWSMDPAETIALAVPERSGILEAYWGANPFKLHTEYAGALPILVAVLGFWLLRRNRYIWFFAALGIFTLTISYGGYTPIYRLYYEFLPGTSKFRAPNISFYLLILSLVVVGGLALDRLAGLRAMLASRDRQERNAAESTVRKIGYVIMGGLAAVVVWAIVAMASAPPLPNFQPTTPEELRVAKAALNHPAYVAGIWRFGLFLAFGAGALWYWLRGKLSHVVAGILLAVGLVADLWVINRKFLDTVPAPATYFAADEIAHFLQSQPGPFRTFVYFDLPQDNYLTLFGVELVGGEHGNQLQAYNEFLGTSGQSYTDYQNVLSDPRFLALTNAKYFLTTQELDISFLVPVFKGRARTGQQVIVYENTMALPRAFVVPNATRAEFPDGAITRMKAPDFDPTREVVLYEDPPMAGAGEIDDALGWETRVIKHEPTEVVIEVNGDLPGYLVLTDAYYPDWTATVDGTPTPVLRANHAFRAVPISEGRHTVTFRFEPRELRAGLAVSASALTILGIFGAGLGVQALRRRRGTGK